MYEVARAYSRPILNCLVLRFYNWSNLMFTVHVNLIVFVMTDLVVMSSMSNMGMLVDPNSSTLHHKTCVTFTGKSICTSGESSKMYVLLKHENSMFDRRSCRSVCRVSSFEHFIGGV